MFVLLSVGSEHEHQLVCFLEMTSFAGIVPIMYITIVHRRCQVGNHGIKNYSARIPMQHVRAPFRGQ
jgi:hypothetical protein